MQSEGAKPRPLLSSMKPEEFHFTPMIKFQVKVPKGFTYILFEPIKFHESIE